VRSPPSIHEHRRWEQWCHLWSSRSSEFEWKAPSCDKTIRFSFAIYSYLYNLKIRAAEFSQDVLKLEVERMTMNGSSKGDRRILRAKKKIRSGPFTTASTASLTSLRFFLWFMLVMYFAEPLAGKKHIESLCSLFHVSAELKKCSDWFKLGYARKDLSVFARPVDSLPRINSNDLTTATFQELYEKVRCTIYLCFLVAPFFTCSSAAQHLPAHCICTSTHSRACNLLPPPPLPLPLPSYSPLMPLFMCANCCLLLFDKTERPVMIEGAADKWPALKNWTLKELRRKYGDARFKMCVEHPSVDVKREPRFQNRCSTLPTSLRRSFALACALLLPLPPPTHPPADRLVPPTDCFHPSCSSLAYMMHSVARMTMAMLYASS